MVNVYESSENNEDAKKIPLIAFIVTCYVTIRFLKCPPHLRDCSLVPTLSTLLILFVRLVVRLSETM